jgi:hypothetical protein
MCRFSLNFVSCYLQPPANTQAFVGADFFCSHGDEQQMVMTMVREAPPMALQEYFLQSKISYLLSSNLTHKTEIGTRKGGRLLIATHLDQSNHLANQQQVLGFAMPFASLNILCKNAGPKLFC